MVLFYDYPVFGALSFSSAFQALYNSISTCYINTHEILITLLKPLSFLPALLMMYIIFSFSAQTGEVSGELSYKISYQIVETKNELLNTGKSYDELAYEAESIHYYVRKAAHMTEYCLLAIAISFPRAISEYQRLLAFSFGRIICVGFAGLDEYHQSFVSGRTPGIRDVGFDSIGSPDRDPSCPTFLLVQSS